LIRPFAELCRNPGTFNGLIALRGQMEMGQTLYSGPKIGGNSENQVFPVDPFIQDK